MHILFILLGAILLYYLQCVIYRNFWLNKLSIQIKFQKDHATEGDSLTLTETVVNQKLLPLPVIRVKFMTSRDLVFLDRENSNVSDHFYRDDLLSILMYQKLTRTLRFQCSHRGYFTIEKADIVCNDIFLSQSMAEHMEVNQHLYVYPRLLNDSLIELPFKSMLGTILTKRFYNEDPFEFAGIREYQIYDTMRNINWKASAKTGELLVNVHDYTAARQVMIILNLESQTLLSHLDLIEESIRLAATYANAFIQSGIPTSLYTNGVDLLLKEPVTITAGSGESHMTQVNEGLSRIDVSLATPPFLPFLHDLLKNSTKQDHLLLISTYQKPDLQELLVDLKQKNRDYTWIVPLDKEIKNEVIKDLASNTFIYQMPGLN